MGLMGMVVALVILLSRERLCSLRSDCRVRPSAVGLVVKYLVANEMPRVRFPDGALLMQPVIKLLTDI